MGWQDAPLVDAKPAAQGKWAAAPLVDAKAQKSLNPLVDYHPGIGLGETALALGSGAVGGVAGGISGLATGLSNALGITNTPPGDRVRQVSEALSYQPRTAMGRGFTGAIAYPFEKLAEGADAAGGYVTDIAGPVAGTAVNTGIQSLPMLLGPAAKALPGESAGSIAARARTQALNATREARVEAARAAGLRLTPTDAGGGTLSRILEGLSGEPKLAKLASKKNAPTVNDMIRNDVGMADDVPLSRDALAAIRAEEGANYEFVKSVGRFETDSRYKYDLRKISHSFDTAAKDFAHRSENPLKKTMEGLDVKAMDAASAVEEVKLLRADADKAYRAGDKQLGKAFKDAAGAIDDMLERNMLKMAVGSDFAGDPVMAMGISRYQAARQRIAKTYAADKALNDATGNIDVAVYAKALKDGKKLSGPAKQVAEFGQQFPRSLQRTEKLGSTAGTYFDLLLGGTAGAVGVLGGGLPGAAALGLGAARPLARSALLTDPVQGAMSAPRSYGPSTARTLQEALAEMGVTPGIVGIGEGQ
jgi:hypothetical protein